MNALDTSGQPSAETLADRRLIEDGYARVNAMWKTQGPVATLRYVHHLPHGLTNALMLRHCACLIGAIATASLST